MWDKYGDKGVTKRPRGCYRRAVQIDAGADSVRADMEDDFHCFGLILRHDGRAVTAAEGIGMRIPRTTCAEAVSLLGRLVGLPLPADAAAVRGYTPVAQQCTHLFDLACLAAAHSGERGKIRYDMTVNDPDQGVIEAAIERDGELLWRWRLRNGVIESPPLFAGQYVPELLPWAREHLSPAQQEAVFLLRRALRIARGRSTDHALKRTAADLGMPPSCYTFQPENAGRALSVPDSQRDFSNRKTALLRHLIATSGED